MVLGKRFFSAAWPMDGAMNKIVVVAVTVSVAVRVVTGWTQ